MAKKETATEARALVDLPAYGVRSGELLTADADVIASLAASGDVDPHPDAVKAAKEK